MSRTRPATGAVLLALALPSCDPSPAPATSPASAAWPAGTVLAVNGQPIDASAALPWEQDVALLYPGYGPIQCRRLALTNIVLPRAAAGTLAPEARERARRTCEEARERIEEHAGEAIPSTGTWRVLGFDLWGAARRLAPGVWSDPIELPGRWVLLRLVAIEPGRAPDEEELTLERLEFPYVDPAEPGKELRAAIDASTLVVVDADWGEAIPEDWKHRMKGEPR